MRTDSVFGYGPIDYYHYAYAYKKRWVLDAGKAKTWPLDPSPPATGGGSGTSGSEQQKESEETARLKWDFRRRSKDEIAHDERRLRHMAEHTEVALKSLEAVPKDRRTEQLNRGISHGYRVLKEVAHELTRMSDMRTRLAVAERRSTSEKYQDTGKSTSKKKAHQNKA